MNASGGESVIYSGHPSWKSMLDLHIAGILAAAAGGAITRLATSNWGYAIAIAAAILALTIIVGYVRRISTHYEITDRRLHIKRGILSRIEQQTTIDRVQNVETRQSLLERVLRIGTVDFDTAATDESQFSFVGVASPKRVVVAVDRAHQLAAAARKEPSGQV
ncbi:MAG TPA: PH domain-containing protein [Solirubrobacteraceae bacterium]|nr:PH domain-containing protein [Solirubrobacteraceae bacterium]